MKERIPTDIPKKNPNLICRSKSSRRSFLLTKSSTKQVLSMSNQSRTVTPARSCLKSIYAESSEQGLTSCHELTVGRNYSFKRKVKNDF